MAHDSSIDPLRHLIQTHPLIDNHAHNILNRDSASDYSRYPFESVTSEAQGAALDNANKTLPHHRAIKQLAGFFSCSPDWDEIKETRDRWVEQDYTGLVKKCLEGTHTLLLDDMLTDNDVEPYGWHDQFTASPTKRIVRIEAVAAKILTSLEETRKAQGLSLPRPPSDKYYAHEFDHFIDRFDTVLETALEAPEVVGFKSVICYRTGLDVDIAVVQDRDALISSFSRTLRQQGGYRIEDKPLNDWLVWHTLSMLNPTGGNTSKPLQFHTGLGDADISLLQSNPAHLQPLIAAYPQVDFVLLHSSYPYTREAGYLACVYPNVYLDLGEVFPMVSREAEESIIRESLEIVPTNRLLWSTDGHFFPETYWLANKQFREAMEKVLVDYVRQSDFTVSQAMEAAANILFNNSNALYDLGQEARYKHPVPLSRPISNPVACGTIPPGNPSNRSLNLFLQNNTDVEFIWMQWVDYTATVRVRMVPVREFRRIAENERRIGITLAVLHMLQDDTVVSGGSASGQFYMRPDLSTLSRNVGVSSKSATVMNFWRSETGDEMQGCPRTTLQNIVTQLKTRHGVEVTFGFEIEVVFLRAVRNEDGKKEYVPLVTNHSWSNMTPETRSVLPLLEEIVRCLASIDIHVEQFHAESSPSQFEFVLPPNGPLLAVDTLIKARQTITNIAEQHGLQATLHPRPHQKAAGSASHAHVSISPTEPQESFLAGVLEHFPAIMPFALSQDVSYHRVAAGIWSGGEWVTWGTQNREAPVRKISPGHWEFKCIDGLANMYFAMSAILAAGYLGVSASRTLTLKDCPVDASTLNETQRATLGITTQLPKGLAQALLYLEADEALQELLGSEFVKNYVAVKRAESQKLAAMEESERTLWILERY